MVMWVGVTASALTVGQRVRTVRDTQVMSGPTILAQIKKGTDLDVLKIDPKSGYWFQTTATVDAKAVQGWVKIPDIQILSDQCATNFTNKCETEYTTQCNSNCQDVCADQSVWKCDPTTTIDPETGAATFGQDCYWDTESVCHPECTQECWDEPYTACSCVANKTAFFEFTKAKLLCVR